MKSTLSFLVFFLFWCNYLTANYCLIEKKENTNNSSRSISITIEIHRDTAKIVIPPNQNIRIPFDSEGIRVTITVVYKVTKSTVDNFRLLVSPPSGSTLVPVKIPPPPNSKRSGMIPENYSFGVYIYKQSEYSSGSNLIGFLLEKCIQETIEDYTHCDAPSIDYTMCPFYSKCDCLKCDYEPEDVIATEIASFIIYDGIDFSSSYISYKEDRNKTTVTFGVGSSPHLKDYPDVYSNSVVNLFLSSDTILNKSDTLLFSENLILDPYAPPNFVPFELIDFSFKTEQFQYWVSQNKYLIIKVDAADQYHEISEENNILPIQLLPDLSISDTRIYKTQDNRVAISCTIKNAGNITTPASRVSFYRQNYPRQYINHRNISELAPGQSKVITLYVSWGYYLLHLDLSEIILTLDPDKQIQEIDETNNEINVYVPRFTQGPSRVTVSPNPFSGYGLLNFDFKTTTRDTNIKLSIYNQKGILEYHTQKFYTQPDDQQISIPFNNFRNQEIYHYSMLFGTNSRYHLFSGSIIIK